MEGNKENTDNNNMNDDSDDSDSEEEARHPLEEQFISMFPSTPRRYIRARLASIQNNNPEAVARLTEELLRNPTPKSGDWSDPEDDEVDEDVEHWKEVKLSEMRSLFPDRCPDWLIENLNNISVIAKGLPGNNMIEKMENQFIRKAEEIFSLSEADRAKLPSLKAWK